MGFRPAILVLFAACGRVDYDPLAAVGGDSGMDAPTADVLVADVNPLCGACGDVDADGDVDDSDAELALLIADGLSNPLCQGNADVLADGTVTPRDVQAIAFAVASATPFPAACAACTLACGDADASGAVNVSDISTANDFIENGIAGVAACQVWAANANGNMAIDAGDVDEINNIIFGGAGACLP